MRKRRRALVVVVALVVSLATLSGTATGSDDPFNGSWTGVSVFGNEAHLAIGGGNHRFVLQMASSQTCGDDLLRYSGFGDVVEGVLHMTGDIDCIRPGEGRVTAIPGFSVSVFDNGDGTLSSFLFPCSWPTGQPEACP